MLCKISRIHHSIDICVSISTLVRGVKGGNEVNRCKRHWPNRMVGSANLNKVKKADFKGDLLGRYETGALLAS